nr:adenine-specific methyltransferase EcoRI family protein [Mycoplasmopsis agassizii]
MIKEKKIWLGRTNVKIFKTFDHEGEKFKQFGNVGWFTNLEHGLRHEKLKLLTMEENLIYDKRLVKAIREAEKRSREEKPRREAEKRSREEKPRREATNTISQVW